MKKVNILIVFVLAMVSSLAVLLSGCSGAKIPHDVKWNPNMDEWKVTFEDNFDGNEIDYTKWKVNTMGESHIRRAAYYTDSSENLFVKDGNLVIRTNYKENGEFGEGWYTSWLETSVKNDTVPSKDENYKGLSQKQGYFEIRCQTPPSEGIWSAFWMMPDEGVAFTDKDEQWSGKDGVEIDIMESPYYYQNKSNVTHVIHGDGYDERLKSSKSKTYNVPNMYSEMHTYALEWTEDTYRFYIDGWLTWETNYVYDGKVMGVSDVCEYMILSVEVGGHSKDGVLYPGVEANGDKSWAGNPNKNDKAKNYDFIIDYVKVMQRV